LITVCRWPLSEEERMPRMALSEFVARSVAVLYYDVVDNWFLTAM